MQNARVTFLTTPDRKAAIEAKAASLGVSSGEYIRLAVDNFDRISAKEEVELAALAAELNAAVPAMRASLDRSNVVLEDLHAEMNQFFQDRGIA
ncbi:plasmid mobilization protein [Sphingomonas aerophila]|jgi:hypothetical protein|uniref:Uncharacterized protein n=1 Tax=Sphingomonas aerophila TaxID=1344948 RepID=A0A7W9BF85_9SPHN|nr:hypothetical protein [Sphingomonas aerophila]MBB5716057.1 hypothetical protein [Sphingomonas aerophila]